MSDLRPLPRKLKAWLKEKFKGADAPEIRRSLAKHLDAATLKNVVELGARLSELHDAREDEDLNYDDHAVCEQTASTYMQVVQILLDAGFDVPHRMWHPENYRTDPDEEVHQRVMDDFPCIRSWQVQEFLRPDSVLSQSPVLSTYPYGPTYWLDLYLEHVEGVAYGDFDGPEDAGEDGAGEDDDQEPAASLLRARAKLDAIREVLPPVDWEANQRTNDWLDAQFQKKGRRRISRRPKK
jgi:hypothetical protein